MEKEIETIIMAAGSASRWDNHMDIPKQLAEIDGEPILHRLFRLLEARRIDFKLTVPRKGYFGPVPCEEIVGESTIEVNKFLNAKDHWKDKAIYLYGDVYWTEEALDTALSDSSDLMFFGRSENSPIFGRNCKEIFALKISKEHMYKIEHYKTLFLEDMIENCGTWGLYDYMDKPDFTEINDWTQDFDHPETYNQFVKLYNAR